MAEIRDYVKKLRGISENEIDREIFDIVYDEKDTIEDLNTSQLMLGKNSEGGFISPPYRSPKYASFKMMLNPLGVVDLKLTGEFHSGIFVRVDGWPIRLSSRDSKTPELQSKYGDEIFGLDKENSLPSLVAQVKPGIQNYFRKVLSIR